jgi:hypothetical protein
MKKKIINVIGVLVIFSIGMTFGKLLNWGYFELDKGISIIDALSLFVTIGVAIYVAKILEKEVQDVRIEKELYLAKITELESLLSGFESLIEEQNIANNKIISRIHSCRIKKNSIFCNIKHNFKQVKATEFNEVENEITNKLNSLKRLLTETPAVQSKTPELSIKKGLATFSPNRIIEIDTEINSINECLFKMKVRINNL